jgi:inhibitor of KinA
MRIFPLGDNAITVEFGNEVSLELNGKALALADHFRSKPFAGLIEVVPAYASTTFFFSVPKVHETTANSTTAFGQSSRSSKMLFHYIYTSPVYESRIVEIPMIVTSETAIDLDAVAAFSGLASDEVISIFLERNYNVFMIAFFRASQYMVTVDERIAMPRKKTPRTKVPQGSVASRRTQTGVYPLESPAVGTYRRD